MYYSFIKWFLLQNIILILGICDNVNTDFTNNVINYYDKNNIHSIQLTSLCTLDLSCRWQAKDIVILTAS